MVSPRNIDRYPRDYFMILTNASGELTQIQCESEQAAFLFRNELYVFRKTLVTEALARENSELLAEALLASTVSMALRGKCVILSPRLQIPELYPSEIPHG